MTYIVRADFLRVYLYYCLFIRIFAPYLSLEPCAMGNIILKSESGNNRNKGCAESTNGLNKPFVLSDVTKEELAKRRIPVYSYLL